jgi:hypothetical protein
MQKLQVLTDNVNLMATSFSIPFSFNFNFIVSCTRIDIAIFDLPFIINCKRLSITSDISTMVACNDDRFKDVLLPSPLHSLSPVLESMPCDSENNTIPDLPKLAICNQLSITS